MSVLLSAVARLSPAFALFFGVWSVNLIPLRRDRRALRLVGAALFFLLIASLILLIPKGGRFRLPAETIYYYIVYLSIAFTLFLCCEGSIYDIAYVTVIGQMWQHFLYALTELVLTALALCGRAPDPESPALTLSVFFFYCAAYLLMQLLLRRYFRNLVSLRDCPEILLAFLLLPHPADADQSADYVAAAGIAGHALLPHLFLPDSRDHVPAAAADAAAQSARKTGK